jgi:tripartite-type tricarboxylate transporter receptor subunit TctC
MKRLLFLALVVLLATVALVGWTPSAAAPAQKVEWPEKGKAVTVIVGYPAGGGVDVAARLIGPILEKDLGVPFQVVNRAGAGGQVGLTALVNSKPDGYTIGYTINPTTAITYLDAARKAAYTRKSFQPIANQFLQPHAVVVVADSPYKTLKELVDAAKATPDKITHGTTGLGGATHMSALQFQKAAGIKLATVHFDGDSPQIAALLGGHIAVGIIPVAAILAHARSGKVRIFGIMDRERSENAPDVMTLEEQGYKAYGASVGGISAPAGVPQEMVTTLAEAIKRAVATDQHKTRMGELGYTVRFMDTAQYKAYWDTMDIDVLPLIQSLRQ